MIRLVSDRPRSWSYTFGLGHGLTALVLVLILTLWSCFHHWLSTLPQFARTSKRFWEPTITSGLCTGPNRFGLGDGQHNDYPPR